MATATRTPPQAQTQTPPRPFRFTIEQYEQLNIDDLLDEGVRVELIGGEIIEMSPIGVSLASCVDRLARELILRLGRNYRVSVQNPVQLPPDTMPQPDLAVAQRRRYVRHPIPDEVLIVIEVADRSLSYDRNVKFLLYAAAGIAEAWLVDVNARIVERHTEPGPDGYAVVTPFGAGDTVTSTVLPGLAAPVADIFA